MTNAAWPFPERESTKAEKLEVQQRMLDRSIKELQDMRETVTDLERTREMFLEAIKLKEAKIAKITEAMKENQ